MTEHFFCGQQVGKQSYMTHIELVLLVNETL